MKNLKGIILASLFVMLLSCGQNQEGKGSSGSGSASQATPNDSSAATSRKAIGTGEDNQKNVSGYPSNQSNLNSDSTSKRHDLDTTTKQKIKDKPDKHQ